MKLSYHTFAIIVTVQVIAPPLSKSGISSAVTETTLNPVFFQNHPIAHSWAASVTQENSFGKGCNSAV